MSAALGKARVLSGKRHILGHILVAGSLTVAAWTSLHRHRSRPASPPQARATLAPPDEASSSWPNAEARLTPLLVTYPPGFGVRRVYIDAGHGAPGNPGNTSCFCEKEQDYTLFAARALAERLMRTGHFEVRLSRDDDRLVDYHARVDDAARFGAEAFLSLHSDVRKRPDHWSPSPGERCPVSYAAPGFAVLYTDEGAEPEVARRRLFAREAAFRLQEIGLLPYDGADYALLYEADPLERGAFTDRHAPDQRIFVLHRPPMPSILIETHHALDPREETRFRDPTTLDAFASAITAALVSVLPQHPP